MPRETGEGLDLQSSLGLDVPRCNGRRATAAADRKVDYPTLFPCGISGYPALDTLSTKGAHGGPRMM